MPSLEITIDADGNASMKIKGVKGSKCKPIHASFNREFSAAVGADVLDATDTPEMLEEPIRAAAIRTAQRQEG